MNPKDEFIADFAIKNHYVSPDTLDFIKTRQTILETNGQELNLEEELLKQNLLTQEQVQYINQEYYKDHSAIKEKTSSVSRHDISQHEKSQHEVSQHDISQHETLESQTLLDKISSISATLSEHTKRSTIKGNIEELYPKTEVTMHKELMQKHISKLETIRRYNLLEERGHGGMGVVYKAFDTILKRNVAIKLLLPQEGNTPIQFQRFLIEAQAAAKLNHPNIVAVYDIAQLDAENFYLVMEYIEGKSLADIITERAPLSLAESIEIIWQTTLALQEAHFHNIIHRDIKPGNILITPNNLVKVTDFGLAKILSETSMVSLSASGQFLGTPHYVAPEQIDGKNIDGRADLYALGVTFYQMLTKHFPFESKDIYSLIFSRLKNPPTPIEVYRRDIPESIEKIIQKLLAASLENRYANATELLDDLNDAIQEDSHLDILNEQSQSRIITYIPKKYKKQKKGHKVEVIFILLFALVGILSAYYSKLYLGLNSNNYGKLLYDKQDLLING
jgi:serine/threonine protein kinase